VVIHEVGHFVAARLARVRVLEFGIGFPPRAKVMRSKGETLYTLNWLPIGGFVKLEGEDGNDADDPRSFSSQRYSTKMLILVAGVAMNVVLALRDLHRHRAVRRSGRRRGGRWRPETPAAAADRDRRRIVTINGKTYVASDASRSSRPSLVSGRDRHSASKHRTARSRRCR
jgi:hypothetical protein